MAEFTNTSELGTDGRDALLIACCRWAACFAALAGQSKPALAAGEGL